jgi:hypothetical protein
MATQPLKGVRQKGILLFYIFLNEIKHNILTLLAVAYYNSIEKKKKFYH